MIPLYTVGLGAMTGFVFCLLATPLAKRIAFAVGAVAVPKADRWHRDVVPLLGGLAIGLATVAGLLVANVHDPRVWTVCGAACALLVVGLVDDIRPLKPQSKLLAQIIVATGMTGFGLRFDVTGVPVVDLSITIVWVVGITNAFNLLDNMDGLAAGTAAITVGYRLAFFLIDGDAVGAASAAVLLGALAAFLVFNFNPASIFMGDAGSLFLGLMVSGLPLIYEAPRAQGAMSTLLFPVLVVLVPIFDTTLVSLARLLAGRRVSVGGRDHSSHRLVALGLSEREAVLLLYAVSVASGAVALMSYVYGLSWGVVFIAFLAIGLGLLGVYLGRISVYPEGEIQVAEGARFFSLVADFSYKRQVATLAIDFVLMLLAYYVAYLLRFEAEFALEQPVFAASLPIVVISQLGAFAFFRLYQGSWRHTGLNDLMRLGQAATVGSVLAVLVILGLYRFEGYSRAVFVINWVLLILFVAACRLSFRAFAELLRTRASRGGRRVLIYGAGDGGLMVLRELTGNLTLGKVVVGFIDDDHGKLKTTLHGVPVIAAGARIGDVIDEYGVDEVIVSTAKIQEDKLRLLASVLESREIPLRRAALRLE